MKSTNIKVTELTNEEMLNHSDNAYNKSVWIERVNRMIEMGAKFYECKPDAVFSYSRFFTTYTISEGLNFLSSFSPYSAGLTSNGFIRAFIINGEIFKNGFGELGNARVVNNKEGRKWLADNICKHGGMISSCI